MIEPCGLRWGGIGMQARAAPQCALASARGREKHDT